MMAEYNFVVASSLDFQNPTFSPICSLDSVRNRKNLNSPLCETKDVFSLTFLHIEEEDDAFSSTAEVYYKDIPGIFLSHCKKKMLYCRST